MDTKGACVFLGFEWHDKMNIEIIDQSLVNFSHPSEFP